MSQITVDKKATPEGKWRVIGRILSDDGLKEYAEWETPAMNDLADEFDAEVWVYLIQVLVNRTGLLPNLCVPFDDWDLDAMFSEEELHNAYHLEDSIRYDKMPRKDYITWRYGDRP